MTAPPGRGPRRRRRRPRRPAAGTAGPPVCGWQSQALLAQVARATLLAPAPPSTCRCRWSPGATAAHRPGLVRAATAVAKLGHGRGAAARHVEVVVVIVDAPPGPTPARSYCGRRRRRRNEPTVVAAKPPPAPGLRHPGDPGRAALAVRVTSGAYSGLAGVLWRARDGHRSTPAISGAGSGCGRGAVPAAPVTVRHQAPTHRGCRDRPSRGPRRDAALRRGAPRAAQ